MTDGSLAYMNEARATLDAIAQTQLEVIEEAAALVARAVQEGHMLYLFGTGHSHMLCEEGHYRAGGLAATCPILSNGTMLHESAVMSTQLERMKGLGPVLVQRYQPRPNDVIIIFSNSGVNAVPVEAALAAQEIGMKIIAVVSLGYATVVEAGPTGRKLHEIADIVIDNQGPPGDALIEINNTGMKTGPISTISGAFILNSILTEVVMRLAEEGAESPPVYISANMPGAAENNAALVARYRLRNPHL
jgi:uncharacterized phosphosugar-binding protein